MQVIESGVYFLFKGEKLVYIGQSNSIYNRIGQHVVSDKDFDSWEYYEVNNEDGSSEYICLLESYLINHFNPPYNTSLKHGNELILLTKNAYMAEILSEIRRFEHLFNIRQSSANKIIRCKDCMYYEANTSVKEGWGREYFFCPFENNRKFRHGQRPYDYCSRAVEAKSREDIERNEMFTGAYNRNHINNDFEIRLKGQSNLTKHRMEKEFMLGRVHDFIKNELGFEYEAEILGGDNNAAE